MTRDLSIIDNEMLENLDSLTLSVSKIIRDNTELRSKLASIAVIILALRKGCYSVANISDWMYLGADGFKYDREQACLYTEEEAEALVESYPEKERKYIDVIDREEDLYKKLEELLYD